MIMAEDGRKMSKSLGNVITPDVVVAEYGADTLRLYEMFIGDFEKSAPWANNAIKGCKRFIDRLWNLSCEKIEGDEAISETHEVAVHRAMKKVGSDIENLKFNTAIATMMALVNDFYANAPSRGDVKKILLLLSPFAPHAAEELWEIQGFEGKASEQVWPKYDESKTLESEIEMAVQVMGKLRSTIKVALDSDDETVIKTAVTDEKIKRFIEGKEITRTIVVKNKLVNIIAK
jgi:leucyl-tRNA synthetase